jgi:hypothetical protein
MYNAESLAGATAAALTQWLANANTNFPVHLRFENATLRLFVASIENTERSSAHGEVDAIYQQILKTRRTYPFALDDYLILIRSGESVLLLDEELERDSRVCRTLVWHQDEMAIETFLMRTPFAELPKESKSTSGLSGITMDLPEDLMLWVELAARKNFTELSAKELVDSIPDQSSTESPIQQFSVDDEVDDDQRQDNGKAQPDQERFL